MIAFRSATAQIPQLAQLMPSVARAGQITTLRPAGVVVFIVCNVGTTTVTGAH